MKKFLIVLAVVVGLLLCIFHNEINVALFIITTNEGAVAEDIIESGSPNEVVKIIKKQIKLKIFGSEVVMPKEGVTRACWNPDPEVLRTVLDDNEIKNALDKEAQKEGSIDYSLFTFAVMSKNAPEKVKILLGHGYDPYKINPRSKKSAMDSIQENYEKIDPRVFDVIREYYR